MSGEIFEQLRFGIRVKCPICESESIKLGDKRGHYIDCIFSLRECIECTYAFIENPCVDFGRIYDENYYRAKGADPLTDYMFELDQPETTIRTYELEGIVDVVRSITGPLAGKSWLDFGCGNGVLVRHLCATTPEAKLIAGFEQGWIADEARRRRISLLSESELERLAHTFDVVSAVEVLEHVLDPVETLSRIRKLLRPGGLFFYTTGNSSPFRRNLLNWRYVLPEIHVGFFNPRSMSVALEKAGFETRPGLYRPGFDKIIQFKVLKNLGVTRNSRFFNVVPWSIISRLIDMKYRLSGLPTAFARQDLAKNA